MQKTIILLFDKLKENEQPVSSEKLFSGVTICPRIQDSSPRCLKAFPKKIFLIYLFFTHIFYYWVIDRSLRQIFVSAKIFLLGLFARKFFNFALAKLALDFCAETVCQLCQLVIRGYIFRSPSQPTFISPICNLLLLRHIFFFSIKVFLLRHNFQSIHCIT